MPLEEILAKVVLEFKLGELRLICDKLNISIDELLDKLWTEGYFRSDE